MYMCRILLVLFAAIAFANPQQDLSRIAVQNAILAKVNGRTISMIDVKKKMDVAFHQNYPHLEHSNQARLQFYEMSWRPVLLEIIDGELILADAGDKEVKLSDGEIREEMENRFGPNVTATLDKLGLTYEESWEMVKNELIVRRMNWWFVHAKALQNVTPEAIRKAYRSYLDKNPACQELKYQTITVRSDEKRAEEIYTLLKKGGKAPDMQALASFAEEVQISAELSAKDIDLSGPYKSAIAPLAPGSYSKPSFQTSRNDKKGSYRIFYLAERIAHEAPSFETMMPQLQGHLTQKAVAEQSQTYLNKLRKHYGFDPEHLKESLPEDLHPFSLQ